MVRVIKISDQTDTWRAGYAYGQQEAAAEIERLRAALKPLSEDEQKMFDGALDVAVQLAKSENEQHKGLGQIIAGVCAIIHRRFPDGACEQSTTKET